MTKRWLGIVVSGDKVTFVDGEVHDNGPIVVQSDQSWPLQQGERASAYVVMAQQISDYATEHDIELAVIKESAVSLGGTKKAHLQSAELRGVVMAALAGKTTVECKSKAVISKTFGNRKVDDYVKDSAFWTNEFAGDLRAGSREAAMMLLVAKKAL